MRVVVHLSRFYDWEKLPPEVHPTPDAPDSDFAKAITVGLIKPSANGAWLMRVERAVDTHTLVVIPESQLSAEMIESRVGPRKQTIGRKEAMGHAVARAMADQAQEAWITGFEVEDLTHPDEVASNFHAHVDRFVAAGKIPAEHKARMLEVFTAPHSASDHVDHLHARFNVKRKAS
jgi:hypothetical protein